MKYNPGKTRWNKEKLFAQFGNNIMNQTNKQKTTSNIQITHTHQKQPSSREIIIDDDEKKSCSRHKWEG